MEHSVSRLVLKQAWPGGEWPAPTCLPSRLPGRRSAFPLLKSLQKTLSSATRMLTLRENAHRCALIARSRECKYFIRGASDCFGPKTITLVTSDVHQAISVHPLSRHERRWAIGNWPEQPSVTWTVTCSIWMWAMHFPLNCLQETS